MGHRVILVWLRAVGIVVEEVLGNGRDAPISFQSLCGNRDRGGGRGMVGRRNQWGRWGG